jgi:hypothetical protein
MPVGPVRDAFRRRFQHRTLDVSHFKLSESVGTHKYGHSRKSGENQYHRP